jgi:hypothetical protein
MVLEQLWLDTLILGVDAVSAIDVIVTDRTAPEPELVALRTLGVETVIA